MTLWSGKVLIRTIRSENPNGYGGMIFFGYYVERGEKVSRQGVQVKVPWNLLHRFKPSPWDIWAVTGDAKEVVVDYGGWKRPETVVDATELVLSSGSGQIIVEILSHGSRFAGIGERKARDLWCRFGKSLYDILDNGCVSALEEVLSPEIAARLAEAWSHYANGRFISFLQQHGFPPTLARKVLERHGRNASERLEADPYLLLSYCGSWNKVDSLAKQVFNVVPNDPRRLSAAVEEALYSMIRQKDTAATPEKIRQKVKRLLFVNGDRAETSRLCEAAMSLAATNGSYLMTPEGLYQTVGPYVMEAVVASRIAEYVAESDPQMSLLLVDATSNRVDALINQYEDQQRVSLTTEQRSAVHTSVKERFSIITGGAGTGKTTVLRCLYYVLNSFGYGVVQMALAGKAAKRMREATGKESHTIAGFLKKAERIQEEHGAHTYYVIDEASMLDLKTAYRLFEALPNSVRIVMVGDPYQLPPIGAGLIFHKLVGAPSIPQTRLTEVKRQEGSTGIPQFAAEIRKGTWPSISPSGIRIVPCVDMIEIMPQVLGLFLQDPDRSQIICAVHNHGASGVAAVNTACQMTYNPGGQQIMVRGVNGLPGNTKFRKGDRIIFTRNDWDRGVMNGTMGVITECLHALEEFGNEESPIIGMAHCDGEDHPILLSDVLDDPMVDLGYAVTCHKAQGSQFHRVIVPVHRQINCEGALSSRIMDLTWVYTALTRAECEVIFVGCQETIQKAVEGGPRWHNRVVGFAERLGAAMSSIR